MMLNSLPKGWPALLFCVHTSSYIKSRSSWARPKKSKKALLAVVVMMAEWVCLLDGCLSGPVDHILRGVRVKLKVLGLQPEG